jgi:small GTP-binding protein
MSAKNSEVYKFKLSVLGDASVGKTSLIRHFCDGYFKESYLATLGVSFLRKEIITKTGSGKNERVILQIWDLGGQALFTGLRQNYIKGSQGALVLFDITHKPSLVHVESWVDEFYAAIPKEKWSNTPVVVVGNKIDLEFDERIKQQSENLVVNKLNLPLIFTSAKTGENMKDTFKNISKLMIKRRSSDE